MEHENSRLGPVTVTEAEEEDRIEKIKDNLRLLNQIMEKGTAQRDEHGLMGLYSRSSSVYLPLPNHNYVQSGKLSVNGAPAKVDLYQIKGDSQKHLKTRKNS